MVLCYKTAGEQTILQMCKIKRVHLVLLEEVNNTNISF